MKNSTFKTVVKTKTTTQKVTTKSGLPQLHLGEHNKSLLSGYSGMIGVKTGSARGQYCLVFAATRNGKTVIARPRPRPSPP